MANDKMMAQMSSKPGFIAALDQSGGSTPGALRLYGIPDSEYKGDDAKMFELVHEMRVRIISLAGLQGRQGHRRNPVRAHDGQRGEGQTGSDLPLGGAGRRPDHQGRQGSGIGKGRRQRDEANAGPRQASRPGDKAWRLRHQDALGHQSGVENRHRRHRQAAVRIRRTDLKPRAHANPRAGNLDQEPRQGGRRADPARRTGQGARRPARLAAR